jgi:Polyketide cyclase / dehydrase and lipid transport
VGVIGWLGRAVVMGATAVAGYAGLVTGAISVDLRVGRRSRPLGPLSVGIDAPRELVFDVIAEPYLGRQTRAVAEKIKVLERGADMVLAAHFTRVHNRLVAQTVETVRFTRPERVDFRLVRGPVPYVVERFTLTDADAGTRLEYQGELATDLWAVGQRWGDLVARRWERVVADSLAWIKTEAERRRSVSRGTADEARNPAGPSAIP